MNMQQIMMIAGGIAMIGIIVFVYVRSKKGNNDSKVTEFFEFLDSVSDRLGDFIADAIEVLKKDPSQYANEDEFYKDLIGQAIRIIKELCEQNGIELKVLDRIPDEDLENYIYMIIERIIDRVEVKAIIEEQPKEEVKVEEEIAVEEAAANLEDIDNALNNFYEE